MSYRALKRRFDFDDNYLKDLKAEIIKAQQLARDAAGWEQARLELGAALDIYQAMAMTFWLAQTEEQ